MHRCIIQPLLMGMLLLLCAISNSVAQEAAGKDSVLQMIEFNGSEDIPQINHGDTAIAKTGNGHYVLDINKSNRFWALRLNSGLTMPEPNVLEMKMKLEKKTLGTMYGLIWSAVRERPDFFDEYVFLISTAGEFYIYHKTEKGIIPVGPPGFSPSINTNGYNTLRVQQSADSLHQFYINDHLLIRTKLPKTNLSVFGFYVDPHNALYVDYIRFSVKK